MVTWQVPVPEHPDPDQPVNVEEISGVAVNVTGVPVLKLAWHVAPHVIPAGLEETAPVPVPVFETVRTNVVGDPLTVKLAEAPSPGVAPVASRVPTPLAAPPGMVTD